MDGVQLPQGYSHFKEAVYFLPLSSQKFLVLILSTLKGWKAESTLEAPSGFKHKTPGLGIQRLHHSAIAQFAWPLYTKVMFLLIWISFQHLQNFATSLEKGQNSKNHSSAGFHHPIKNSPPLNTFWKTLDIVAAMFPEITSSEIILENILSML